jgi:hypothetical protein
MTNSRPATFGMPLSRADSRAMIVGFALVAIGSLMSLTGLAIGAAAGGIAARRWLTAQPEPPTAIVKRKIGQVTAATAAGTRAWQTGTDQQPAPKRTRS